MFALVPRPLATRLATLAALAAAAPLALARPAGAQLPAEYRYDFTVSTPDEESRMAGTVYVAGDRWRIDVASDDGGEGSDYLLSGDGGRTITVVHPDQRSYSVHDAGDLERIVSRVMHGLDAVLTMQLRDVKVATASLGAGQAVAGRATQRYRLTQEYEVSVGMFGVSSDTRERVVTDYWVDPRLALPRNPVVEMVSTLETALAQHDPAFVRRSTEARRALFRGTPLKVVVTAESREKDGATKRKVRTIQLGEIQRVAIDAPVFEVPRGFERKEGDFSFSM
jgi:hypothetical protein